MYLKLNLNYFVFKLICIFVITLSNRVLSVDICFEIITIELYFTKLKKTQLKVKHNKHVIVIYTLIIFVYSSCYHIKFCVHIEFGCYCLI